MKTIEAILWGGIGFALGWTTFWKLGEPEWRAEYISLSPSEPGGARHYKLVVPSPHAEIPRVYGGFTVTTIDPPVKLEANKTYYARFHPSGGFSMYDPETNEKIVDGDLGRPPRVGDKTIEFGEMLLK